MKSNKTGLIIALKIEADPFINGLGLVKICGRPFPVYKLKKIYLAVSGMGQVRSALAASYLINTYHIKRLYNFGSAGAASGLYKTGDIFHIDKIIDYSRLRMKNNSGYITPRVLRGCPTASLATLDAPVLDPRGREEISAHAGLIDMEGYGFAKACGTFNADAFLFKIVSDGPDAAGQDDIIAGIKKVSAKLFNFFADEIFRRL